MRDRRVTGRKIFPLGRLNVACLFDFLSGTGTLDLILPVNAISATT
jgi:hypothetical protein